MARGRGLRRCAAPRCKNPAKPRGRFCSAACRVRTWALHNRPRGAFLLRGLPAWVEATREHDTMTPQQLDLSVTLIRFLENGYVNNPKDPGGSTNAGITQSSCDVYRNYLGELPVPVAELTNDQIRQFYSWYLARCPIDLGKFPGLACAMAAQFYIDSGAPHNFIVGVQCAVGTKPDGDWGNKSASALVISSEKLLIVGLRVAQMCHYVQVGRPWDERGLENRALRAARWCLGV